MLSRSGVAEPITSVSSLALRRHSSAHSQKPRMLSRLPSPVCEKFVPLMVDSAAVSRPVRWAPLPFRYSSTTGFFFCGMMLDVPATLSGKSINPNSGVHQTK